MAEKLWGGRFTKKTDPLVEVFTRSSHYDYKLAACDIRGSHLHVDVLYKSGYLSRAEADKLHKGLEFVARKIKNGRVAEEWLCCEDIHTYIQNALLKKVGVLALKLHTARSRNDQVAFDTKLYAQVALLLLNEELENLCGAFALGAKKYAKLIIPGFTHLQHAQPVRAEDYLNAYAQMLRRDQLRLSNAAKGITLTQGAGALAGTPVEHSHYQVKGELSAAANALDAVSDRDFVIEIIAALSILTTHLSRLAEDLILWSSKEFSFVDIDEAYCTGSSLMPQK
ncbi:MAG: argininosuccinate lyase, partial [Candidatus Omnitrophica bacterium]|nr:argininosuccinate lyase [Candidatus Omnitrophota bacterium]